MIKYVYLIVVIAVFSATELNAQLPEDAIRMSWGTPSGTARNQAIGGAMGSLGGEITSVFVNPAGIGSYKTSEFVFTPGISLVGGKSSYRGTATTAEPDSKFNLGTTGFVFGQSGTGSKWSSKAFSIAVNRTANFNSNVFYRGDNDFSSFSEAFAEEFANSGLRIDTRLFDAPLSYGTKLAAWTYLIDTVTANGSTQVVGLPERDAILNGTDFNLRQEKSTRSKGGVTELAFAYAANMDDKLYIGGSLGIPILNYERTSVIRESDILNNAIDTSFNSAEYREVYEASGFGINAKIGIIIKPTQNFRAGLAIHTPTLYGLKEHTTGSMQADLQKYLSDGQPTFANEDSIYYQFEVGVPEYRYDYISPWKFLVSGSYVFGGIEDVSQQKGFVTADIEYVTHRSSRFHSADEGGDNEYYDAVNEGVKASYKGAFNFRVGGELKFNTVMTRLGFAYYGNPYEDNQLKARKMNVSGGLGYRNKGVFIDAAYVLGLNKDVNFPYRLADKANTFAMVKDNNSTVVLTVGFKF
jgi:hypothetical protein